MSTNRRLPADRDRMVARLRHMTAGSAAAGVAGTMLFGALAAATYDGAGSTSPAVATTDDSIAQVATNDSVSTNTEDDGTLQATQPPAASSSTNGAHASTGGS